MRFNSIYGDVFTVPEAYIRKLSARIMGLQDPTSKMSKSSENINDVVFLDDDPDTIMKKFKKAVTDSENIVRFDPIEKPGISNLMQIYGSITGKAEKEIEEEFQGRGYGDFKMTVANAVIEKLKPIQDKYNKLLDNPTYLEEIYVNGAKKARELASKTLQEVKEKIGIL